VRPAARTALAVAGNAALTGTMRTHQAATAAQTAAAGTGIALAPTTPVPATFPGAPWGLGPPLMRDVLALIANSGDTLIRWLSADVQHRGVPVLALST
jgi:DNA-binding transcriptional LysR family regulator